MEYLIVGQSSTQNLESEINRFIKDNWIPLGGMTTTSENVERLHPGSSEVMIDAVEHTYYQTITRTRKPNKVSRNKWELNSMDVVDLFNETFKHEKVTQKRAPIVTLLTRITILSREHFNNLSDWAKFFESLKLSPFLMGNTQPNLGYRVFKLSLEWTIKPVNLAKIIDGKFHGE